MRPAAWSRGRKEVGNVSEPSPVQLLLVDDSPGDVRLMKEALASLGIQAGLQVARDGVEAMETLRHEPAEARQRPDLVLLDLNMPRKSGLEVLAEMKQDPGLWDIPVVVLTTSDSEKDIAESYRLHANCYITKPVDLNRFLSMMQAVNKFWMRTVKLPPRP